MYPLDARFFNLPAQAIEVSLAGIEPPCDDKDTVMWTKEATKYWTKIDILIQIQFFSLSEESWS